MTLRPALLSWYLVVGLWALLLGSTATFMYQLKRYRDRQVQRFAELKQQATRLQKLQREINKLGKQARKDLEELDQRLSKLIERQRQDLNQIREATDGFLSPMSGAHGIP